jgi:hypothetical protein
VWDILEKRHRVWRFYAFMLWMLPAYIVLVTAQWSFGRVYARYQVPDTDHSALTVMIIAVGFFGMIGMIGMIGVVYLYALCWTAACSRVVVRAGRFTTGARRLRDRIPVLERWKRTAAKDPLAEITLVGVALTAVATIIALVAWLFPLN